MSRNHSWTIGSIWLLAFCSTLAAQPIESDVYDARVRLAWSDNYLTLDSPKLTRGPIRIHYLEAYCRPNSTTTDWVEHTVIGHTTRLVDQAADGSRVRLQCKLTDGVLVDHDIQTRPSGVALTIVAKNPTDTPSQAHWAQPCMRVGQFTGCGPDDTDDAYAYIRKSFIFQDGKQTFLPSPVWSTKARYTPGQVWSAPGVSPTDVNPRPYNPMPTDNGLIGCVSHDNQHLLAMAFHPYQELFQGVIRCLHSDFRIGGLEPGEQKTIRGFIYLLPNDSQQLLAAYHTDFAEVAR